MNQLVYSQKLASQQFDIVELVKQAFRATPAGLFLAALRSR